MTSPVPICHNYSTMIGQLCILLLAACLFFLIRGSAALSAMVLFTLSQFVMILLPFALAVVVLSPLARKNHALLIRCFGFKPCTVFISVSTILHEFSHAAMCVVFRHRIVKFRPLPIDSAKGETGLVLHGWDPGSIYQSIGNFFIGVAPMIVGISVIYILTSLCFREFSSWHYTVPGGRMHWVDGMRLILPGVATSLKALFRPENIANARFYVYLVVLLIVGNSIAPSLSDIRNSAMGVGATALGLFILNCILNVAGVSPVKHLRYVFSAMGIGMHIVLILVFIGGLTYMVLLGISLVKKNPAVRI